MQGCGEREPAHAGADDRNGWLAHGVATLLHTGAPEQFFGGCCFRITAAPADLPGDQGDAVAKADAALPAAQRSRPDDPQSVLDAGEVSGGEAAGEYQRESDQQASDEHGRVRMLIGKHLTNSSDVRHPCDRSPELKII